MKLDSLQLSLFQTHWNAQQLFASKHSEVRLCVLRDHISNWNEDLLISFNHISRWDLLRLLYIALTSLAQR